MPNLSNPKDHGQAAPLSAGDDYSKYSVSRKTELVYILHSIMEKGDLISASFDHGKHLMLTAIVGLDPDQDMVFLDFGSNEVLNQKICESDEILFVTLHDRVKVQFAAKKIEKTLFDGRDAFRIKLPDSLVRLQRREYFRVPVQIVNPLKCTVPLKDSHKMEVAIVDISVGGVCNILPSMDTTLEPGMIFEKCQLELPDVGTVEADMEVMNVFEVTLRSGARSKRAGCRFVNLSPKMQAMLQRYITQVDRARLAMLQKNK